jgi:uncharacterized membrane protein
MALEIDIPTWVLALSYWLHLIATVTWLGGLMLMTLIVWPAVRKQVLTGEAWGLLSRRLAPWITVSLVVLWISGFLQMTADPNYEGFLAVRTLWAQAILVKHIAVLLMTVLGLYLQWRVHPALERLALLEQRRPDLAEAERTRLGRQEIQLMRVNLVCAGLVLLCTAVATAL